MLKHLAESGPLQLYFETVFFIKEPKKKSSQIRKIFSSLVAYWFSVDNRLDPIII